MTAEGTEFFAENGGNIFAFFLFTAMISANFAVRFFTAKTLRYRQVR